MPGSIFPPSPPHTNSQHSLPLPLSVARSPARLLLAFQLALPPALGRSLSGCSPSLSRSLALRLSLSPSLGHSLTGLHSLSIQVTRSAVRTPSLSRSLTLRLALPASVGRSLSGSPALSVCPLSTSLLVTGLVGVWRAGGTAKAMCTDAPAASGTNAAYALHPAGLGLVSCALRREGSCHLPLSSLRCQRCKLHWNEPLGGSSLWWSWGDAPQ